MHSSVLAGTAFAVDPAALAVSRIAPAARWGVQYL
jgi:hypothetical protein